MTQAYTKSVLRVVVAQICQTIGWHTIQNSALEILVDILHHYIQDLSKLTHRYSEHYGYTVPNLDHLALAFHDLGINLDELEEYVQFVEPVPCAKDIAKYPISRESHLNFLKPGSREVVHRPVHVHEHLPPMHPEMEEDEYNGKQNVNPADTPGSSNGSSPLSSPKAGVFKRPGEPISSESSVSKRSRSAPEEEGRPLREITSVIMTTSGFLSPAREGKLPESRIPIPPSDSRSNSPQPPSYPMVPPEVKGEKKSKKGTVKKSVDGLKRLDKENKKKDTKSKEAKKSQKHMLVDDSKVKKLISMKEVSKLKALKTGALKSMARSSSGGSGSKSKMSSSKMSLSKSHSKAFKFNKISSQPKIPKVDKSHPLPVMPQPKNIMPCVEKIKSSKTIEGKLSSEPNKQKLNIFKKISKVKEEKFEKDKFERIDPLEVYPKDSRESSPDLVIDELEIQSQQRKARLAQLDECINEVIMRGMKETTHDSKQVREGKFQVMSMSGCLSKNDSPVSEVVMAHGPDSSKDVYMFDDNDLSPPGTPSTPKTPDFPALSRKLKKMSEKLKKKAKSVAKKESKGKLAKDPLSVKKIKVEVNDFENPGRPKTPEVPEPQENVQTPVFPFFPSFPPAPGLIPPPLGHHPLFPRFPLPYTKPGGVMGQSIPSSNLPHPAMPNLPLPPPLFMQPRAEEQPKVKDDSPEKMPPVSLPPPPAPLPPVVKTEKIDKPQPPVTPPKEKSVEKKSKEHKKEKKDKDKVKKKKDKKDKTKGKDKSEKKKEKEEKKEREKDKDKVKEKKEKKEKKKDKEREDKSETSVPKLTLKLPPSSPRPPTPDQSRKIVIKTVVKKSEEHPPPAISNESSSKRAPSPELAKFSALITRPPKQKGSSKPPPPHPEPPAEPVSYHPPPPPMPPPQLPVVPVPSLPPEPPPAPPPPPPPIPAPPPVMPVPVPSLHMLQSTSATPLIAPPKSKKATKPFSKSKPKDGNKKPGLPEPDAPKAFYYDKQGNKVWICPACGGQDDGSPMIGCDDCDAWYHWVCVGMQVPPDDNEDWYCRVCIVKKEESLADKKKKARKKK